MTLDSKPSVILLVGPTGVGKTEISLQLAERLGGEIISADSRLFYRGMNIGTAKPSIADRRRVPHHLIDIADPNETISLADFQRLVGEAIADILSRERLPLLVGGTGQYIRAATRIWQPPAVPPNPRLRAQLELMKKDRGADWLHGKLTLLDPAASQKMDPRNARRTIRALEVILTSGHRFSELRRQGESPYRLITVGLRRPRRELYARIDARIELMFQAGWLDETRALLGRGYSSDLPAMSAIGYPECVKVTRGEMTLQDARMAIRRATRVFVRRQANWFRESDPSILWYDAADPGVIDAVQKLMESSIKE
jgi:tRNA dimethylallyltransferase